MVGLLGLAAAVLVYAAVSLQLGGETGVLVASDLGSVIIVGAAAAVVLAAASKIGLDGSLGRQWLAIGIGVAVYALGDAVWAYYELILRVEVPYPGPPDAFYFAEYVFVGAGVSMAALAYRGLVPLRRPLMVSAVFAVALLAAVYVGLLGPYVIGLDDVSVAEKVVSSAYPVADVLLGLTPAIFLVLVVSHLGAGRLGWPWWAVAIGWAMIAASDSGYAYMAARETYASGSFVDYGWILGHVAIAVGASIAQDLATVRAPRRSRAGRGA